METPKRTFNRIRRGAERRITSIGTSIDHPPTPSNMKTISLYRPHTHAGVAYDPPPEGIALTVSDADAALLDAWGLTSRPNAPDATAPIADAPAIAPRHDRRARVAVELSANTDTTTDTARTT